MNYLEIKEAIKAFWIQRREDEEYEGVENLDDFDEYTLNWNDIDYTIDDLMKLRREKIKELKSKKWNLKIKK